MAARIRKMIVYRQISLKFGFWVHFGTPNVELMLIFPQLYIQRWLFKNGGLKKMAAEIREIIVYWQIFTKFGFKSKWPVKYAIIAVHCYANFKSKMAADV